jgi:cobalamin biosynthesis protein CbiD
LSPTLAQIGIELDLDDGDLVSDAVLIAKVHKPDGGVRVIMRASEGTDWVTQRGLIAVANDVDSGGYEPS